MKLAEFSILPLAVEGVNYLNLRMHRDVLALNAYSFGWKDNFPLIFVGVLFTLMGLWLTLALYGKSQPSESMPRKTI